MRSDLVQKSDQEQDTQSDMAEESEGVMAEKIMTENPKLGNFFKRLIKEGIKEGIEEQNRLLQKEGVASTST